MKEKIDDYLDIEIPNISKYKGISRYIKLLKIRMTNPSYDAIYMIRYIYVHFNENGFRKFKRMIYYRRLVTKYGIFLNISSKQEIGKGLFLPHPNSIIIGSGVNIGNNCTIFQNVTIGAKKRGYAGTDDYPQIGNDVVFYAGAVAIGRIKIEDGTQIGANSVLITDTEKDGIYAGIPAVRKS